MNPPFPFLMPKQKVIESYPPNFEMPKAKTTSQESWEG